MILGNPALRTLALMKLRGGVQRQLRKFKSVLGCFYALVGGVLGTGWILTLVVGRGAFSGSESTDPAMIERWTQLGLGIFVTLNVISAASVRGVYLPRQEIERLFSAPLSRSDLVRYRMVVDMFRTLFGAIVLALITFHRMPNPIFGFLGGMTSVLTLGVLRQAFSLIMGSTSSRLGNLFRFRGMTGFRVLLGIAVWLLLMSVLLGSRFTEFLFGSTDLLGRGKELMLSPTVDLLLLPLRPWAGMMTATTLSEFSMWSGICVSLGLILYEVTARLPFDYRENSLETSEAVSKRLTQLRRGGVFTGGKASERTVGWQLPRLFGSGKMGAIAWVKLISVIRKARGTLLVGVLIVTLVTMGVTFMLGNVQRGEPGMEEVLGGSGLIALLGITYLGGALRFDFRSDLDRMVQIKSWPVSNVRIFIGTLLPQVFLISSLLSAALIVRLIALQAFHVEALLILLALPFLTFAWLAVDNAVYLFAPVRFVPGQEGSLHHAGRAIVLLSVRIALMAIFLGLVGSVGFMIFLVGPELTDMTEVQAIWLSTGFAFAMLLLIDAFLALVGGWMLKRFDVARDRG